MAPAWSRAGLNTGLIQRGFARWMFFPWKYFSWELASTRWSPLLMISVSIIGLGCVSTDESLVGIPLRAQQYNPIEHLPPVSSFDEPLLSELIKIHGSLRDHEFMAAREELDRQISAHTGSASARQTLPHLFVLRGMTRFKAHDFEGAMGDYSAAIALDEDFWPAYFHRWQCNLELGNRAAANSDREKGRELEPREFERDFDPHPAGGII